MPTAAAIRLQIETALSNRIPSALSPAPKIIRSVAPTGIEGIDELLNVGLPVGAITEMVGPECSGRTALALSFIAHITETAKVCAWIDASNTLHPESAATIGVDLARLLWIRCGAVTNNAYQSSANSFALPDKCLVPPLVKKGLHGGGFGPHPRSEVKGLSDAVSGLLRQETIAPQCAEPQHRVRTEQEVFSPNPRQLLLNNRRPAPATKPWSRLDLALRVTEPQQRLLDLLRPVFGSVTLEFAEPECNVPFDEFSGLRQCDLAIQASN